MSLGTGAIWTWQSLHLCDIHSQQRAATLVIFPSSTSCPEGAEEENWFSWTLKGSEDGTVYSSMFFFSASVDSLTETERTTANRSHSWWGERSELNIPEQHKYGRDKWMLVTSTMIFLPVNNLPSHHSFSLNCLEMSHSNQDHGGGWSLSQVNRPMVLVFGFGEKTGGGPHLTCRILQTLNPHHHLTGHRKMSPSKWTFDLMSISIDFNQICIFSLLIRVYSHGAQTHRHRSPWCVGWMNDEKKQSRTKTKISKSCKMSAYVNGKDVCKCVCFVSGVMTSCDKKD